MIVYTFVIYFYYFYDVVGFATWIATVSTPYRENLFKSCNRYLKVTTHIEGKNKLTGVTFFYPQFTQVYLKTGNSTTPIISLKENKKIW